MIEFNYKETNMKKETKAIPKIIHYVWVGGNAKPHDIKKCMHTWLKHLKGYEIKEWNETNFDINSHPFLAAAYKAQKWAFVSDYIRAYVIYHEGGIYLDTDVILLDNFDKYLSHDAFVGFEKPGFPFTAVFGAKPKHPLIKKMLDYYDNLTDYEFNFQNNNTISVSDILIKDYHCNPNNTYQELKDGLAVYPDTVFCNPSKNSTSIHIFTGSWLNDKKSLKYKLIKSIKLNLTTKTKANLYYHLFWRGNS